MVTWNVKRDSEFVYGVYTRLDVAAAARDYLSS